MLGFSSCKKSPYLIKEKKKNNLKQTNKKLKPRFFLEPLDKISMGISGLELSPCRSLCQTNVSQEGQRLDTEVTGVTVVPPQHPNGADPPGHTAAISMDGLLFIKNALSRH